MLVEDRRLPIVALRLVVRGGQAAAPPAAAGLATFTSDMLDEGAAGRSALAIAEEVERLGASLASVAGYDSSELALTVLRPRLEAALDLLADLLLRPDFPADDVERVREERRTRILRDGDDPHALADHAFAEVLYGPEHPWGASLLGTPEALARHQRSDVEAFWRDRFHPGNATLIVVGDVSEEDARGLLESRFGEWTARPARRMPLPVLPTPDRVRVFIEDRPGASQSEIRVGKIAVARTTPDDHALAVLNTVLGGAFTSRLNRLLREEKGFTYGAGSGFSMRREPGPFVAGTAVHTPVTAEAVADILREIRRMGEEPVPAEELDRARRYVAYRFPQRFETVGNVASRLAELALYGLPDDYFRSYVDRILAVSVGDVTLAARDHLDPDRMAVVVAGDGSAIAGGLGALGVGPVIQLPVPSTGPPERGIRT